MDIRSLTREEAQHRAHLLEVTRYDVDVDLTGLIDADDVRCVATIAFGCRTPGASSFVDCAAQVVSATLNGNALHRDAVAAGRIELARLAPENVLVVESVQSNTRHGAGVRKAVDPGDGEIYLWMSFEPDECKHVWANFDQPDLKAPHRFTVTAPSAWTVLSNSGDAEVDELGDSRRWSFADTPPLSTYNPVVLAGPFHEIRRQVNGFDLGLYTRRSLAHVLERDSDELFEVTAQGLEFYGDRFAMPFPQRRYDQAFLPDFGGAMENYGCVAWSDAFMYRSDPTPAERESRALVLLHEMAHMWFGNIVTMRWWDDLWLNEAFAEFVCNWAAASATRFKGAWARHLAEEKLEAYLVDQGPTTHAIRQDVPDVDAAGGIFDAITYPKGASVLAQLMHYVGEDAFVAGMRSYFAKHAWSNTVLEDLMAELAAASGRDLDAWTKAWLETAGTDRLVLEAEDGGHVLVGTGPEGRRPRPQVLKVGAYRSAPEGLDLVASVPVEVQGERTPVPGLAAADLYLVNDEDLTFASTRPDPSTRKMFFEQAGLLPTPISRGVAVATVWDMLTMGEVGASDVVASVLGVLERETSDSVVEPFLELAVNAAEWWSPDSQRADLMSAVAELCLGLAEDEHRRRVALRGLARTATTAAHLAALESSVDGPDLRWRTLTRLAQLDRVDDDVIATAADEDDDPDVWIRALAVRTARPTVEDKAAAWHAFVEERSLPVGMSRPVALAFWRPDQAQLLAPYAERYLAALPTFGDAGMIFAMATTSRLFPLTGIDTDYLDRVVALAESGELLPAAANTARERADLVGRMLAARGR